MNTIPWALALLAAGIVWALLCGAWPRLSLAGALAAIGLSGLLCIGVGLSAGTAPDAETVLLSWPLPIGAAELACDGLSAWFLLALGGVCTAVAPYSWGYLSNTKEQRALPMFGALACVLTASIIVVLCAANVVVFLVGWELMSLSAFFLIGFHHREPEVRRGAWMYLTATHLGTAVGVLPVLAAMAARAGSTDFSQFASAMSSASATLSTVLFGLGLIGFGTKAGLVPFHVWLPVAHPVAPSPVSAMMSAVVIKTGIYGLLRLLSWLPPLPSSAGVAALFLGTMTGIVGILYALGQQQIKRMLAYSSVENVGIILIGIGIGILGRTTDQPTLELLGFAGALLHLLNHAMFKALLFLSAGAVIHATGTGNTERLGGLARRLHVDAVMFLVGAIAICALPPMNGFLGEFLIYRGLLEGVLSLPSALSSTAVTATAGLALIGGLALAGFTKVFARVFLGAPKDRAITAHASPRFMLAGMLVLVIACASVAGFAWTLTPQLAGALRPIIGDESLSRVTPTVELKPLSFVAGVCLLLAVCAGGLAWFRSRRMVAAPAVGAGPTWGCGFARPSERMQYSGGSFARHLMLSFRHVLRARRTVARPSGYFPGRAELATSLPDVVESRFYDPLFAGVARACERCWPLQHGRIQLYLLYIVGTLLIVFAVESWQASRVPSPTTGRGQPASITLPPAGAVLSEDGT